MLHVKKTWLREQRGSSDKRIQVGIKSLSLHLIYNNYNIYNIHLASGLGFVAKCTLSGGVKNINVDGRSYCVYYHGKMKHPDAFEFCKKLNARLPLPRNKQEADEFLKISPGWTNVDARNPKKTSNKAEWVDAENKPLGNRPVYLRGQKIF